MVCNGGCGGLVHSCGEGVNQFGRIEAGVAASGELEVEAAVEVHQIGEITLEVFLIHYLIDIPGTGVLVAPHVDLLGFKPAPVTHIYKFIFTSIVVGVDKHCGAFVVVVLAVPILCGVGSAYEHKVVGAIGCADQSGVVPSGGSCAAQAILAEIFVGYDVAQEIGRVAGADVSWSLLHGEDAFLCKCRLQQCSGDEAVAVVVGI